MSTCIIPELNNWVDYFEDMTIYRIKLLNDYLNKQREQTTIYPDKDNVFRIFKDLNPQDVKVVILAQDPYYDGNANGYAFGCANNISPSLKEIWNSIDTNNVPTLPKNEVNMNLEYLVKQGVMLLNTVLTVEKDRANSHKNIGWKTFTRQLLIKFSKNHDNVVYLLWGNSAKQFERFIDKKNNLILTSNHPVYYRRNNIQWNCKHFEETNQYLENNKITPIKWK